MKKIGKYKNKTTKKLNEKIIKKYKYKYIRNRKFE